MPTVTVIQPTIAEEKSAMIRCAAYCRVSSDNEDQLNSFMAQTRYYSHIFENSKTEILVDIYADEGVTGTCEDKREEFQRMMKDCRKGKIDRIYTKSISRFARNTRDCLKNMLAGIFADEGISGTQTKKRTEFNRMIRMCKNKKIDLVITKSISRFARNTVDCLEYVRQLKQFAECRSAESIYFACSGG